jgi:hypothetical protein
MNRAALRNGKRVGVDLRVGEIRETPTVTMCANYRKAMKYDPCAYCGGDGGELDHITAVAVHPEYEDVGVGRTTRGFRGYPGFRSDWANLTGACARCNRQKKTNPLLFTLLRERLFAQFQRPLEQLRRLGAYGPYAVAHKTR